MAQLPGSFNSSNKEDMMNFSAFEVKKTPAQIIKSSMESTNDKKGKYLKLEFKILAGKYKGNHVWTQLNLINDSEKAVDIAERELATICRAVGKVTIDDSQQLHGIPMLIDTVIEKQANYPDKTKIAMYYKYEGDEIPADTDAGSGAESGEEKPKKRPWD